MTASEDYCDLCDLPRSTCIHGRPPTPPAKAATAPTTPTAPRKRAAAPRRALAAPTRQVNRRWTPPEVFKPLILDVLEQGGGEMEADDVLLELEVLLADRLLPGDREKTPEGELRWRYAARRARVALLAEGQMVKTRPGVWQLAK